ATVAAGAEVGAAVAAPAQAANTKELMMSSATAVDAFRFFMRSSFGWRPSLLSPIRVIESPALSSRFLLLLPSVNPASRARSNGPRPTGGRAASGGPGSAAPGTRRVQRGNGAPHDLLSAAPAR